MDVDEFNKLLDGIEMVNFQRISFDSIKISRLKTKMQEFDIFVN